MKDITIYPPNVDCPPIREVRYFEKLLPKWMGKGVATNRYWKFNKADTHRHTGEPIVLYDHVIEWSNGTCEVQTFIFAVRNGNSTELKRFPKRYYRTR